MQTWRPPSLRSDLTTPRMPFCSRLEDVNGKSSFDSMLNLNITYLYYITDIPLLQRAVWTLVQQGGSTSELYRPIIGSMAEIQTGSCCVLVLSRLAQQSFCSPCCQNNAKQPWGFVNVSHQGHSFRHSYFLLPPHFHTRFCAATSCAINFFPAFNWNCSAKFGSELK